MTATIEPFHAIAVSGLAHRLKAQGRSIIHMEFGQPSTGAPAAAIAEAHRVLDADPMGYWESPALKARIVRLYAERHGVEISPAQVILTCGASPGSVKQNAPSTADTIAPIWNGRAVAPATVVDLTDPTVVDDPATDEVVAVPAMAGASTEADADGADGAHGGDEGDRRRRRWPWVLLILVVLLGIGGAAAAVVANQDSGSDAPALVLPVPNLVGRTEAQARAVAQAGGWKTKTVEKRQNGSKKGEVLATSPTAGTRLPDGRTITLTVSLGQEIVAVPTDLANKSYEDAAASLEAVGLVAKQGDTPYSEDVDKGIVISTAEGTPAELERGSTVTLVVSNGPEPRTIPGDLVGGSQDAAVQALEALGLKPVIVKSFSDSVKEGTVISVLPAAGETVERGSSVNVEVSQGPELVAVPSITGADSISEAVAILQGAGLKAGSVSGPAAGSPQGTSPGAGTKVKKGSTVNIILG